MKKTILISTFCLISFFAEAQILPEAKPFNDYSQTIGNKIDSIFGKKDYPSAINQINDWYVKYNQLT